MHSLTKSSSVVPLALLLALAACQQAGNNIKGSAGTSFAVDPFWPKPLPKTWLLGEVAGVDVDKNDHVWILQRRILTDRESGAA